MSAGTSVAIARRAVRIALRAYRRHPFAIVAVAAVVFAPLALIDSYVAVEAEDLVAGHGAEVYRPYGRSRRLRSHRTVISTEGDRR